jgi:hypothetical protein
VGFAFGDIRRGAIVSLISGMDIPLILRKTDTGSWALVEYAELNPCGDVTEMPTTAIGKEI